MITTSFDKTQKVRLMGSWGETEWEEVTMRYNIGLRDDKSYGWFELYQIDDIDAYYAEGGLWIRDGRLYDYDGIFALPQEVKDWLIEQGVVVDL